MRVCGQRTLESLTVAQAIDVSLQYSGGYGFESHPRQVTGRNRFLLSICMVECSV